jgi:hypothetical protein
MTQYNRLTSTQHDIGGGGGGGGGGGVCVERVCVCVECVCRVCVCVCRVCVWTNGMFSSFETATATATH